MGPGFNDRLVSGRSAPQPQRLWVPQLVVLLGTLMGALLTMLFWVPTVLPGAAMLP
jgi:hypothetical protein